MKKIFCICSMLFSYVHVFSQSNFFEKSIEPIFSSGTGEIIHDSTGNFYLTGSGGVGLMDAGIVNKIDINGNYLFQKYFYFSAQTYLCSPIITNDHNLVVCGGNRGCDTGPDKSGS